MSYPASVTPFIRRLMAHSTNTFKIEPSGSRSSIGAGQIVSFQLPSNSIVDLKSLRWLFNAKATSSGAGSGLARLPNKIESLVERYSVECGGQIVYQGHLGYNVVKHAKDALEMSLCKEVTRNVQAHEEIPRVTDCEDTNITAGDEAPDNNGDKTQFCVSDWLGFMEAAPELLDLSLLPEVTLKIYLAPDAVCSDSVGTDLSGTGASDFTTAAASPNASYQINNQRLLVTTYSINDGMFDLMLEQRIKDNGFIEVPFKQYFSFFDGAHSGSTRFSIGTQSLDKLYAVWRPSGYATQGAPVLVTGFKSNGGVVGSDQLENGAHAGEKYVSKYFNFPKPAGLTGAQFQLNGTLYPQMLATPDEWFALSKDAVKKDSMAIKSRQAWQDNYHVYCVRFNQPEADALRLVSGLDTRSMNMAGFFNTTGVSGSPAVVVIAECTSTLRVGAGLSISVVV